MSYLTLNTADADTLRQELYLLMRPEHVREERDTIYHVGKVTHPDTGQEAIELPADITIRLHEEADIDAFCALVEGWVDATAAEEVRQNYDANVGEHVLVRDFLPSAISDQVRTQSEMEAEGWFPEPEI